MNTTISPAAASISASTALSLSSNSPRYLAPATIAPRSSERSRLRLSPSGTSPLTMRCAKPSAIAVLPTPGSPISTGVVLRPPRQHLDGAPDLLVAADDRVESARPRRFRQVPAIPGERIETRLRIGAVRGTALPQFGDGALQRLRVDRQHLLDRKGLQEAFHGHVAVARPHGKLVGGPEQTRGLRCEMQGPRARASHDRQFCEAGGVRRPGPGPERPRPAGPGPTPPPRDRRAGTFRTCSGIRR